MFCFFCFFLGPWEPGHKIPPPPKYQKILCEFEIFFNCHSLCTIKREHIFPVLQQTERHISVFFLFCTVQQKPLQATLNTYSVSMLPEYKPQFKKKVKQ